MIEDFGEIFISVDAMEEKEFLVIGDDNVGFVFSRTDAIQLVNLINKHLEY